MKPNLNAYARGFAAGPVYRKAGGPMIDKSFTPQAARARALREGLHSRLVFLCSWCVSPEAKAATSDLGNLSHGICQPCMAAQITEHRGAREGGAL